MRSRTYFFLFTTLLFIFFVSGCKTGPTPLQEIERPELKVLVKPPDWVLGKGHPSFSQDRYLVGVGFSDMNSVSANESARSNLAKNLKVKVRSTMLDISTTPETHVESVIQTEVDTVLEGVEIKDGWLDQNKGIYYSLAIVERSLASSIIQDRISKIESVLQRNLNEGMKAEKKANVMAALSNYLSGYQKAPSLSPLKSALQVITLSGGNSEPQNISASDFESRIKGVVRSLNLSTVSGDRQIVKTQKGLAEPLIAKVYLLNQDNEIPVQNIPVVFNYEKGQGELEKEKTSGPSGTVQTTIHKISSYEEANHVITVKLNYSRIRSNFNGNLVDKLISPLKYKTAKFNYSVKTPKWTSSKSQAWRESITNLGNQLIKNIPPGENPVIGVASFKDLRYDVNTRFSRVITEDIKTILALAEDLKLKEIQFIEEEKPEKTAKANRLDYYVNGSYRMENTGLEVRARLIDTKTKNIQSSANILIERKELNHQDLVLLDSKANEFKAVKKKKSYQEHLERLVAVKPYKPSTDIKVWTDKKEYEIKEKIVFYIKADKKGYLTMLDISPSGDITVIFPNKFHSDNFIHSGVTYQVPAPNYGFEFNVQGPTGLERIKAIVTSNNISLLKLDLGEGFHSIKKETTRGTRAIQVLSKQVESVDNSEWAEAYSEIFIFKAGETFTRGSREISILE
jgi:TolB-like protein